MSTIQFFDHYSNQEHESVTSFLAPDAWGERPWNGMNIPVGVSLYEDDDGKRVADILVFHPRKEHVKHVKLGINSDDELLRLRESFKGISELFSYASTCLEAFARGWNGDEDYEEDDWGFLALYYWSGELPTMSQTVS